MTKFVLGLTLLVSVTASASNWTCAAICSPVNRFDAKYYLTSDGDSAKEAFEKLMKACAKADYLLIGPNQGAATIAQNCIQEKP
jgi:hypothetical protein